MQIYERLGHVPSTRVDREAGVIRGVKILGTESANGRIYPRSTIERAAPLYEGAIVNLNHSKGPPTKSRVYEDRLGRIRNVNVRADGLFGDLHVNPKHPIFEQLAWDAENAPESAGLSHTIDGRMGSDRRTVESIDKVYSVDLVADPATTSSLYEGRDPALDMMRGKGIDGVPAVEIQPFKASPKSGDEFAKAIMRGVERKKKPTKISPLPERTKTQTPLVPVKARKPLPVGAKPQSGDGLSAPHSASSSKFANAVTGKSAPGRAKRFGESVIREQDDEFFDGFTETEKQVVAQAFARRILRSA